MKKFLLGSIAAMLLTCISFNFSSCNEDTVKNILAVLNDSNYVSILDRFLSKDSTNKGNIWDVINGGKDTSNIKGKFLAGVIENIISRTTEDSSEYVLGVWAYASSDLTEIDTLWFYNDSTILEHYISTEDTLDIQYSGGYLYYSSFNQMIVQINSVYNYYTKRSFDYDEYHIYGVKKPFFPAIFGSTMLTMTDLNTETGEVISEISYTYVGKTEDN